MVTVLVPTHERQDYIDRVISFYKKYNVTIMIVDSSKCYYVVKDMPKNCTYLHFPGLSFYDKLIRACELIDSDIIALSPDDDFIYAPSIELAEKKMRQDEDISLCTGEFEYYHIDNPDKVYHRPSSFISNRTLENKLKSKQIQHFMLNYSQVLWSVYRKDVISTFLRILKLSNFKNDNFIELTIASTAFSMGRICYFDKYFGIREETDADHWGARHDSISNSDLHDINNLHKHHCIEFGNENSKYVVDGYFSFKSRRKKLLFRIYRKIRCSVEKLFFNKKQSDKVRKDILSVIKRIY